jgi:hypothetical protein
MRVSPQNRKGKRARNAAKQASNGATQKDSTPGVGVFDLVPGSGTRRLYRLVVTGFLLLRVLLTNGTPDRIEALCRVVVLLCEASTIPHAEFMQRKLGVDGKFCHNFKQRGTSPRPSNV